MVRRFIAGAICPQCRAEDTTTVEMIDGVMQARLCIECGYRETPKAVEPALPKGRLDRPAVRRNETDIQPVQVMNFPPDDKEA